MAQSNVSIRDELKVGDPNSRRPSDDDQRGGYIHKLRVMINTRQQR